MKGETNGELAYPRRSNRHGAYFHWRLLPAIAEYEWLAKRLPLRKITDTIVSKRHEAIGKRALKGQKGEGGPYAANKTMPLLRALWNTGRRKSEKTLGASPTDAVRTGTPTLAPKAALPAEPSAAGARSGSQEGRLTHWR